MWQTKYALAVPKTWEWELIFGRAVKAISSPGVRSPWLRQRIKKNAAFELKIYRAEITMAFAPS